MTNLALVTAGKMHIVESRIQLTLPLGETLAVGDAVRISTTGKFTGSNGSTTTENRIYGILASVDPAGAVGTAIRKGVVDGFALTALAYDAIVYLSDTDKTLADGAGTVSTIVGRVIPATATTTGTAYDKILFIDL
jgi:uncharacterized protein with beta-barrel porin domain